ncbi:MAG TPA: hypothetical protein VNE16_00940 [Vicinamibacterales bacterium]|nr:hypothetical protein [Vicinamibacterales bacterium]
MSQSWIRTVRLWGAALAVAVVSASCGGPAVDLQKVLKVSDVSSGWHSDGVVGGEHKIVPSFSFKLTNDASAALGSLQVNAVFRRVGEKEEWGTAYTSVAGADGLAPGTTTPVLALQSSLGYTGTDPEPQMLQNHLFVDAQVTLFAKYGSSQWTKLGEFPIKRVLLTP